MCPRHQNYEVMNAFADCDFWAVPLGGGIVAFAVTMSFDMVGILMSAKGFSDAGSLKVNIP
jgi:hypothetical protein